ncbi:hypothetical protein QBC42DRAFT_346393 [Cladorrhinum samala]|uniref:Protein-S-isoprenylcysteine O-methyltransferase n=1 Tax=Cladorrhinum samala TaxID=585594 RepID=A0AAV9HRX0_9PEZI|nr:hypothetical protein QBC42DRAFT_346393 [Cladorrhinum samala]
MPSLSQTALALTLLVSYLGTYLASIPPHPNPSHDSSYTAGHDSLRSWIIAENHGTKIFLIPLGFFTLHAALLAYHYPSMPPWLLRNGLANGINTDLFTWSRHTVIPLALNLCVGVPLRLASYSALGKNFTFGLARPDRLTTTGIYRWVQHPSYTALVFLIPANVALLGRLNGIWACWAAPGVLRVLRRDSVPPLALAITLWIFWTRVKEEEQMLKDQFGVVWEEWHLRTARFVPGIF